MGDKMIGGGRLTPINYTDGNPQWPVAPDVSRREGECVPDRIKSDYADERINSEPGGAKVSNGLQPLVERLRNTYGSNFDPNEGEIIPICAEAADAIERMQVDLEMADREAMETGQRLLDRQDRITELEEELKAHEDSYWNSTLKEAQTRIAELEGALREIDQYPEHCRSVARAVLKETP
jgi:hypothetical protein